MHAAMVEQTVQLYNRTAPATIQTQSMITPLMPSTATTRKTHRLWAVSLEEQHSSQILIRVRRIIIMLKLYSFTRGHFFCRILTSNNLYSWSCWWSRPWELSLCLVVHHSNTTNRGGGLPYYSNDTNDANSSYYTTQVKFFNSLSILNEPN